MFLKSSAAFAALAAAAALTIGSANAATTYIGFTAEPAGSVSGAAEAAQSDFLDAIVGFDTEDFEGFSDGDTDLTTTFTGTLDAPVNASLSGDGEIDTVGGGDDFGRFNTTDGGDTWYLGSSNGTFTIDFEEEVDAFGFYATDVGDFDGIVEVTYFDDEGAIIAQDDLNQEGAEDGSLLFYGVVIGDGENGIASVSFSSEAGLDRFGIDDAIVGSFDELAPIPLPAAGWMLMAGIAGLAGMRRLRKS